MFSMFLTGLTSKVASMCGGSHSKSLRFAGSDRSSDEIIKILRRDGMDRARVGSD